MRSVSERMIMGNYLFIGKAIENSNNKPINIKSKKI